MKLYNDDCIKVLKQMEDNSVDLIATDPPYLINYKTGFKLDKKHKFNKPIYGDNNPALLKTATKEMYRVLKDNSAIYMFAHHKTIEITKPFIKQAGFNIIIWVKNNHTAGDLIAGYGSKYEMIIYANKGRAPINGKRLSDVWYFDGFQGKNPVHQNQKPLEMIKLILEKHSQPGQIVLDPFMGSGTTGVACKKLNREFIGVELDSEYFEIAKNRIENE